MRLKKIKLAGFKSFVDPTSIPFPDDMTAIVGPNGCGKSNVIDAVRWVLGESSAKNLRGDAMTDVIFNGSTGRKPVSQCSVELVFDNSSGRIQGEFANYTELSVRRLVTRDAQSNYFLNGAKCRRRDVTDLFLGTGLGPRSYAIIEQGMISRLIESKPQELRIFIEEAAGISKYKERRRDTENRIRHTKENLERLEDVRSELGQQIDKLQRQASAARKYKELKAKERKLKAELATLRWQKHSEQIARLESQIASQETDIEAFMAKQRGDEKGMTELRLQQQECKQSLSDVQQQIFQVGTEITRLEQNQLHAKQRAGQIQLELSDLESAITESLLHEQQESAKIQRLSDHIEQYEPEQASLAAQVEQAQEMVFQAQDAADTHNASSREAEQRFASTKQQVQSCHSQIQATMNLQLRTQQRISELQTEQNELEHDVLAEQVESLHHQVAQAKGRLSHARTQLEEAEQQFKQASEAHQEVEDARFSLRGEAQKIDAQISALESVQSADSSNTELHQVLAQQEIDSQPIWQVLQVATGWEKAVEKVCSLWPGGYWLGQIPDSHLLDQIDSGSLIYGSATSTEKSPNCLAEKLLNEGIPQIFNNIFIASDDDEARALLSQLLPHQSVITPQGRWYAADWLSLGMQNDAAGKIQRSAKISELQQQSQGIAQDLQELQRQLDQAQAVNQQLRDKLDAAQTDFKQAEQALTQQQNQLNLLDMQHQQTLVRQTRISEELSRQQQLLEDERLQSETLAMQAEELELTLADMAETQQQLENEKLRLADQVAQHRSQLEQLTRSDHQLALTLQGVRTEYQGLLDSQKRSKQQLDTMTQRQSQLINESQTLASPLEEQTQRLTLLLESKQELEIKQTQISEQLAEVESKLSAAEKGQLGVMEKVQQMRTELESKKLECEGYRVRANSTVEQLKELNQSLKTLLENLAENANEKDWQDELERTSAALARLGAVNLAAVEEYEIQAKRKEHLDEQNQDLVAALETLESAIRKIDKETRSRFKETFDRVNGDLKELFPKVFGGGSAYLELTGEDLLETGVTIMARPPGKKNSTIHLLSGGEKALTALSLVFAIFRLNPAPFCLLDEVDAPLDDANVGRFCKLVSEMSKTVQFIYITHNKIAMEMAKHLTGVTMAEPGVSRMVAVDVEEAVAIAHA